MTATPHQLRDAAAFADCQCPASDPNMIKAREHIGVLSDHATKLEETCLRYLGLLEYAAQHTGDEGRWEDVQAAKKQHQQNLEALAGGRNR